MHSLELLRSDITELMMMVEGVQMANLLNRYILKKSRDEELDYKRRLQFNNISKVVKGHYIDTEIKHKKREPKPAF